MKFFTLIAALSLLCSCDRNDSGSFKTPTPVISEHSEKNPSNEASEVEETPTYRTFRVSAEYPPAIEVEPKIPIGLYDRAGVSQLLTQALIHFAIEQLIPAMQERGALNDVYPVKVDVETEIENTRQGLDHLYESNFLESSSTNRWLEYIKSPSSVFPIILDGASIIPNYSGVVDSAEGNAVIVLTGSSVLRVENIGFLFSNSRNLVIANLGPFEFPALFQSVSFEFDDQDSEMYESKFLLPDNPVPYPRLNIRSANGAAQAFYVDFSRTINLTPFIRQIDDIVPYYPLTEEERPFWNPFAKDRFEKMTEEIERLEKRARDIAENYVEEFEKLIELKQEYLRREKLKQLSDVRHSRQSEEDSLQKEHDKQVAQMEKQLREEIEDLTPRYERDRKAVKEEFQRRLKEAQEHTEIVKDRTEE